MSLGMNIYRLRIKSGMFQDVLAEKLGVSRQSVSKWETDGADRRCFAGAFAGVHGGGAAQENRERR